MTTPNLDILVPAYVREFEPYVPSKPDPELKKLYGCRRLYRLNNNENPLGPPPGAQEVIRHFLPPKGAVYPSGESYYLRREIAALHGIDPDQIVVGNGANEVIAFVIKAFCEKGDNIITADKTFAVYEWVATFSGIGARTIPLKDEGFDDREMLRARDGNTKILFVCNPNNPTGTIVTRKALDEFLSKLPDRVILVLDEAYCDFVDSPNFPDGVGYVKKGKQVIVLRTFSKVYGLAGLRIGYALGREDLIKGLNQVRDPFPVHRLAQVAAEAALKDKEYEEMSVQMVRDGRKYLCRELERLGLSYVPSQANFILIDFGRDINRVFEDLLREGIIIRPGRMWNYPTSGRVTIGRIGDHRRLIKALRKILR